MRKVFLIILFIALHSQNIFAQADSLIIQDTRDIATSPGDYSQSLKSQFKSAYALGFPVGERPYYTIIGLRGWSDNTGGKAHEFAFSDDSKLFFRSGYAPTWGAWRQVLISDENGNYGIGTTTPDSKLAVNGNIRAKEVKVELAGWSDFVFAKDYKLPTLQETEKHIIEKGHLPGIPSAAEVKANGVDLGEMNAKLLQKIEELTLYLIEQNKQFAEQEVINNRLNDHLELLDRENKILKDKIK